MGATAAVFLSASIPDPAKAPEYARTADSVAITTAVGALIHVVLGRRKLVWGGHPAITPMIYAVAEDMGLDYGSWVQLYQSDFFDDQFPEDNEKFRNIVYTKKVIEDRDASLLVMRQKMFTEQKFDAAVFVGGMGGIIAEYDLFRQAQPDATIVPIASTGGATLEIVEALPSIEQDLIDDLDYVGLLHRKLGIAVEELRYPRPIDQPTDVTNRIRQRKDGGFLSNA